MKKEKIAKVCHEVNKAYCESLGDFSPVSGEDAPEGQKQSAMIGVELHINNPNAGAEASHESWYNEKVSKGWVYGEVKDQEVKTHSCMVSFEKLPKEQQAKDFIFRSIVHALKDL